MALTIKWVLSFSKTNAAVKALYKQAFPSEEKVPYFLLKSQAQRGLVDLLAYFDGDTFVGFTYTITHGDITYLFYLAVNDAVQSQGYGSQILAEVDKQHPMNRIILMVEALDADADNNDDRQRRVAFYTSNGFVRTHKEVVEQGVTYEMMAKRGDVSATEYQKLIKHYARWLYPYFKPKFNEESDPD